MKLYPLYEFPATIEDFENILIEIDMCQPVDYEECLSIIHKIIDKRESRTKITLKNLIKLGILQGKEKISLSWESQLYMDLKSDLRQLLLYLIYQRVELFLICYHICKVDKNLSLNKTEIIKSLECLGYDTGNIRTSKEKIYAIKRVIKSVKINERNPFLEYKLYRDSLQYLQNVYLLATNKTNIPIELAVLEIKYDEYIENYNYKAEDFKELIRKLYSDPIYSSYTSFTTAIRKFTDNNYLNINNNEYYYFKLNEYIFRK